MTDAAVLAEKRDAAAVELGAEGAGLDAPKGKKKSDFAKRNPHLERLVPDALEGLVDRLMPDGLEREWDRTAKRAGLEYQKFATDFNEGFGEIAGVLFKVAKYAATRFNIGDIVFGVYHLSEFHNNNDAVDAVEGEPVSDPELVRWLIYCTDIAVINYSPTKEALSKALGVAEDDVVISEPKAVAKRPAYSVVVDRPNKAVVWGFRGTTDLNDMLTDAAAACTPYMDGYAHWGMLESAEWFANNELKQVRAVLDQNPGFKLVLVGHSLGAGVACLLAHWIKNNPKAAALMEGIDVRAVGVATPAVLTAGLADSCKPYVSSVVLMHDVVPRFSIHNVFKMKKEMDDTKWGDILGSNLQDWLVPDVIEKSETYQRLTRHVSKTTSAWFKHALANFARFWVNLASACAACAQRVRPAKPAQEADGDEGAGAGASLADNARHMAAAHRDQAHGKMADAAAVGAVAANVQQEMQRATMEDVHDVFAPGRLFFLRRADPEPEPSEDGEQIEEAREAEFELVAVGQEARDDELAAKAAAAAAAAKMERKRLERARQERKRREQEERKRREAEAKKRGEAPQPAQDAEPYPGATFELVEAAPGQRFGRIVLRQTCLMDHLCGGYIQGLEFKLRQLTGGAAPAAGAPVAPS